jgi:hypothetical protein
VSRDACGAFLYLLNKGVMQFTKNSFEYGQIIVLKGTHLGRVGYLDEVEMYKRKFCGIVKFCHPLLTPYYEYIPIEYLATPNNQQLLKRYENLLIKLSPHYTKDPENYERMSNFEELALISNFLEKNMFTAKFTKLSSGAKIFISHSSKNKGFVRGLAIDLADLG